MAGRLPFDLIVPVTQVEPMHRMRRSLLLLAFIAAPLAAQTRPETRSEASVLAAAATISEADYYRRILVLADDSMGGRGTPSRGLETAAAYIASEFRRFGLRPGGDSGTFFQRYRIERAAPDSTSYAMVVGGGIHSHWMAGVDMIQVNGPADGRPISGPVVLMIGLPTDSARPFGDVPLNGAIVVQVVGWQAWVRSGPDQLLARAAAAGAKGWILVPDMSAAAIGQFFRSRMRPPLRVASGGDQNALPAVVLRDSAAVALLQAAGAPLASQRTPGTAFSVRPLPGFTATMELRRTLLEATSAPNVIGVLEGSDPQLRSEYVFFTSHMDAVGVPGVGLDCRGAGADSICNGADDDASGTSGILELAEAYATLNPRPRRSLVFMTVSGEERGLWGSDYYAEHPTLPLANTVADLNIDMIGRYYNNQPGWRDTIVVIGKEHSSLGAVANAVTQWHPELHMRLIDDLWPQERFYYRSDHYNFARKGVPILFFFNGVHPDYHRVSDSPDRIDAEKAARIVNMVFYIGLDVANATERPQWNPESRRRIVEAGAP
jgi:hypothetical protein